MYNINSTAPTRAFNSPGDDNGEEQCPICLRAFDREVTVTSCGHKFGKSCLDEWLKNEFSCPLCRTEIRARVVVHRQVRPQLPNVDRAEDSSRALIRHISEMMSQLSALPPETLREFMSSSFLPH